MLLITIPSDQDHFTSQSVSTIIATSLAKNHGLTSLEYGILLLLYNTMNIYNFEGKIKHSGDEEPLRMLVNSLKVNSTIVHLDIGLESAPRGLLSVFSCLTLLILVKYRHSHFCFFVVEN